MKTIYLIRHSGPFVDIENYTDYQNVSWYEYNKNMILSVDGEQNALKLCEIDELKTIDEIYASDSFRAIGTAKYLSDLNDLKIKLDSRINERKLGISKISEMPVDFVKKSFEDKGIKYNNGESLYEVDCRFNEFLREINKNIHRKIVVVLHGIILMSYLQNVCKFSFDGQTVKILFNNKIIIDRALKNPDVFKLEFDDNYNLIDITNIE